VLSHTRKPIRCNHTDGRTRLYTVTSGHLSAESVSFHHSIVRSPATFVPAAVSALRPAITDRAGLIRPAASPFRSTLDTAWVAPKPVTADRLLSMTTNRIPLSCNHEPQSLVTTRLDRPFWARQPQDRTAHRVDAPRSVPDSRLGSIDSYESRTSPRYGQYRRYSSKRRSFIGQRTRTVCDSRQFLKLTKLRRFDPKTQNYLRRESR